MRQISARNDAD